MITGDGITSRFSRSWDITKQTFKVMKADKEILLFPVLSTIFSTILFFPSYLTSSFFNKPFFLFTSQWHNAIYVF